MSTPREQAPAIAAGAAVELALGDISAVLRRGHAEQALELARDALDLHPEAPALHAMAAIVLAELRRPHGALREARRAGEGALAQHALGLAWWRNGRPRRALAHFERALAASPGDPDLLLSVARVEAERGREDQARAMLNQIPDDAPADSRVHALRAELLRSAGHEAEARREAMHAWELAPEAPSSCLARGRLELQAGRGREAARWALRAMLSDIDHPGAHHLLAGAQAARGGLADALVWRHAAAAATAATRGAGGAVLGAYLLLRILQLGSVSVWGVSPPLLLEVGFVLAAAYAVVAPPWGRWRMHRALRRYALDGKGLVADSEL